MRAFYASRLSENISQTPEGYLICKNVPIARTGVQEYFGEELNLEDYRGQKVAVHRLEEDVFDPAALASFEGKPATDEHPAEDVTPTNIHAYIKGITTNVRRGVGEDNDKVFADLIFYDPILISQILAGKREISCGYGCVYEIDDEGRVLQRRIRGNHVAVVDAGRAGSQVSIKDSAPVKSVISKQSERRKSHMSKKTSEKRGIWSTLFPIIAKDADPGEVQEALEVVEEAIADNERPAAPPDNAQPATPAAPQDNEGGEGKDTEMPPWAKAIVDSITTLKDQVAALSSDNEKDPIDELIDQLGGGEEAVTRPAEQIDNEGVEDEEGSTTDSDVPATADNAPITDIDPATDNDPAVDNEAAAALTDSLKGLLTELKPVVASMKDAKAKARVNDALKRTVDTLAAPRKSGINGYAYTLAARESHARKVVRDSAAVSSGYDFDQQQAYYDQLNPHKKKEGR